MGFRPFSIMSKVKSKKSLFHLSTNTFDNFLNFFAKTLSHSVESDRKIKVKILIGLWDTREHFTIFCVSKVEADF